VTGRRGRGGDGVRKGEKREVGGWKKEGKKKGNLLHSC